MKSKLFTEAELRALENRIQGNKKDSTGIYASRVKPKLIELIEIWFKKKKQITKLLNLF